MTWPIAETQIREQQELANAVDDYRDALSEVHKPEQLVATREREYMAAEVAMSDSRAARRQADDRLRQARKTLHAAMLPDAIVSLERFR